MIKDLMERIPMWMKFGLTIMTGAIVGVCIACSLPKIKGFRDDAPLEELFEDMIENYTGIEIDVTPNSIEV